MSGKKKSSIPKVSYAKSEDLHLSGTHINLVDRPSSRNSEISESSSTIKPRVVIKRPMSASPGIGYQEYQVQHRKKLPSWSRPQSAGFSGMERRSKIAAKIYDQERDDYQTELGKTYTVSSSQLLQSLLGSCSLNEGLDSDTTAAPSPQPSLGETIKAAAQLSSLEPGLASKPPLPPTPDIKSSKTSVCNDNHHSEEEEEVEEEELVDDKTMDEIIALKFQRWFPDSVIEQLEKETTSLTVLQQKYANDETTDDSDAGSRTSLTEGELSAGYFTNKKTVKTKFSDKNIKQKKNDNRTLRREPNKMLKGRPVSSKPPSKTKRNLKTSKTNNSLLEMDDLSSKISKILQQKLEDSQPKIDFQLKNGEVVMEDSFLNQSNQYSLSAFKNQNKIEDGTKFSTVTYQSEEKHNQNESDNQSFINNQSFLMLNETEDTIGAHKQVTENKSTLDENNLLNSETVRNENQKGNFVLKTEDVVGQNYLISSYGKNFEHSGNSTGKDNNPTRSGINKNSVKITISADNSPPPEIECNGTVTVVDSKYLSVNRDDVHKSIVQKSLQESSASKTVLPETEYVKAEHIKYSETSNNNLVLYDFVKSENLENIEKYLTGKDYAKHRNSIFSTSNHSLLPGKSSEHQIQGNSSLYISEIKEEANQKVNTTHVTFDGNKNKDKSNLNVFDMSAVAKPTKFSLNCSSSLQEIPERDVSGTSYEDIVNMLQVLEKEDLRSSAPPTVTYEPPPQPKPITMLDTSSSARAIFNFLDEVDRFTPALVPDTVKQLPTPTSTGAISTSSEEIKVQIPSNSRFGELLSKSSADLAQKVMKLTLDLEEKYAEFEVLEERYRESQDIIRRLKDQIDIANKKHQKFVEQVLNEKKQMREKFDKALKAMEVKHENTIQVIEERHKIEMKREKEKFATAEKIRRERWIDQKTKKIKEMTVRGLEPELERMARLHQEEISELRRLHQRQLEEAEAGWARRSAAQKEQEMVEREAAIQHEREAARHKLEQEIAELEKSYQEQRKRLLEEVRQEQEAIQKDGEAILEEKRKELTKELEIAQQKLEAKMKEQEKAHQNEIKKLRSALEEEKQTWISQQNSKLLEKQAAMTEQCKRERDRQIELVIRRLESEASDKEQTLNNRMVRMKESHDNEIHQLESELEEMKQKLKDTRSKAQICEDNNTQTLAQLHQSQAEITLLKQAYERLKEENYKTLQERDAKIQSLHSDLTQAMQLYQDQIRTIHDDKEKQLQQVYTRVKEAVSKKEEALKIMQQQRDAALEQCSRLEKMLEQRKDGRFK